MHNYFQHFKSPTQGIKLPKKFTYPFYYDPHPLCVLAAEELQDYLMNQTDWEHNFGLDVTKKGMPLGKMFGVLIVQNKDKELGYLAAVSGKLAATNMHHKFVPPVFDMLQQGSYFLEEEEKLNVLNAKIEAIENDPNFIELQQFIEKELAAREIDIEDKRRAAKEAKNKRNFRRSEGQQLLAPEGLQELIELLGKESLEHKYFLNDVIRYWEYRIEETQKKLKIFQTSLEQLKTERKENSGNLQNFLFQQYRFLNYKGQPKNLLDLFENQKPSAGAGECAAPKLLQYAFKHDLKPLAMAEFWWGQSPNTEIRKHQHFYPACQGKCKPILAHMLDGVPMDTNPLLENPAVGKEIEIVFEDDSLLVVNKPAEFLSVPGIVIQDSVYTRIKKTYPEATGALIVHRLDMSTSGLLILAKTKEANKLLQQQFINKTIKKRYIAVLDGLIEGDRGKISLPLRVDLNDRPRQLVCYDHGKPATTYWEKINETAGKTRVYLYPISGRTHQLRVHTSHPLGLNTPIIGDDLYGTKANRLHLHAQEITFMHPISNEQINLKVAPEF
uniref:pseudouridine synthase n=1 Tax=Polaribacter sp. TaxID=1920175 RepID=UPI004048A2BB